MFAFSWGWRPCGIPWEFTPGYQNLFLEPECSELEPQGIVNHKGLVGSYSFFKPYSLPNSQVVIVNRNKSVWWFRVSQKAQKIMKMHWHGKLPSIEQLRLQRTFPWKYVTSIQLEQWWRLVIELYLKWLVLAQVTVVFVWADGISRQASNSRQDPILALQKRLQTPRTPLGIYSQNSHWSILGTLKVVTWKII